MILLLRWHLRRRRARAALAANGTNASTPPVARSGDGPLAMLLHQARFDALAFARNRQARFFTVLLPLLFLVIFVSVFGNGTVGPNHVKMSTYYVPGISAMAVVAASFVNLVIGVTTQREMGILKRRRATPVPAWVLIGGRALTCMAISLGLMAVVLAVGALAYGVHLPGSTIPGVLLTAVLGSITFCVLGFAFTGAIGNVDAAQPMVQAVTLPLYFVSGVFIPNLQLPTWLQDVARIFPVQRLAGGLHNAFDPMVHGSGVVASDLAVLALWAVAGLAVAAWRFSWVPLTARA